MIDKTKSESERDVSDYDPRACQLCGCGVGLRQDYCDACAREIGEKPPLRSCMHCGDSYPEEQMHSVDLSIEGEYPDIKYICGRCWNKKYE